MRILAVLCTLLVVSTASAQDKTVNPTVRLDLFGQATVDGIWDIGPITFAFDTGSLTIDANRVRKLTFGTAGNDLLDVDGMDHQFRGTAKIDKVMVGGKDYAREAVRGLKTIHAGPRNLLTDAIIPLVTLTAMEIILGIDNIIFLAIIAGKLPPQQQPRARRLGLFAALGTRLLLLGTLSFILGLTTPVITLPDWPLLHTLEAREISWRDIILLAGGMFLIGKSTYEIHEKLEKPIDDDHHKRPGGAARFGMVLIQIAIIDIVFSLDSVITAVGMVDSLWVMVTAMLIAVGVMMVFAETISRFVSRNPTLKILALAFLILIGVLLVADGFGQHINKSYIYFAMAFSLIVEAVNIRVRKKSVPIQLNQDDLHAGIS